ncbi:MAG: hypothetical protein ACTSWZ_00775 [Candidatus Heimdallarchaeaceae archaeon]
MPTFPFLYCLGISDKVYSKPNAKKPIGFVTFYDYDRDFLNSIQLTHLKELSKVIGKIHILKTSIGFHFVNFAILNLRLRKRVHKYLQKYLPSDYKFSLKHRILRLTPKIFPLSYVGFISVPELNLKFWTSKAHLETYEKFKIIPFNAIAFEYTIAKHTYCRICIYKTEKVR